LSCWPFFGKACWLQGDGSVCLPDSACVPMTYMLIGLSHALMPDTTNLTLEAFRYANLDPPYLPAAVAAALASSRCELVFFGPG
jgi:hypothetical protein